ncbi:hypothetical protein [Methanoculleus chikugoensis]|uniref:COG1361 S-layer family protein n=1 Tax=Methanoculleus chikugoensis TaxID=118126 RepID=UPI0006D125F9|nr:hypothetical protein [Methanoculleus chikugoensis]
MMRNLCILLLLLSTIVGAAAAANASAEEQIAVTGVTVNPPDALMRGDMGTVTVDIKNTGGETGVAISRAELYPNGIAVVNDKTYDSVGIIGPPGNTMSFTFTVRADTADGIYYPTFYLDLRESGSVRYSVPVTVESTEIRVSIVDAPETYPANSEDTIVLSVGNPRGNSVNGVTVTPTGEDVKSTQTAVFLGALAPDEEKNASFRILASQSTELTFDVSYRNGINEHHAILTVPIEIGQRTVEPDMVVNNIEMSQSGGAITLTGDVTNAGLKDAYSVKITVDDPATPTDPLPGLRRRRTGTGRLLELRGHVQRRGRVLHPTPRPVQRRERQNLQRDRDRLPLLRRAGAAGRHRQPDAVRDDQRPPQSGRGGAWACSDRSAAGFRRSR